MTTVISANDIELAHERIRPYIHRTPVFTCDTFNRITGSTLFFKCENLQKVGAFKARGAMNALLSLDQKSLASGVATHSSGNHGQALAWAARQLGVSATVVMPSNSPVTKKEAVIGYGARVVECIPTLAARETTLAEVIAETGAHEVHPYNDYRIIAGQGTAAKELVEDIPELDFIFCPVGGGGLLSGTALSAHYFSKATRVIGCEPERANDAWQSFQAGHIIPVQNPDTIADGLKTSLGDKTFPIIQQHVHEIITVSEEEIKTAMRLVLERMKLVIEPSAAVGLAALFKSADRFSKKKIGVIFCGGNVDVAKISELLR